MLRKVWNALTLVALLMPLTVLADTYSGNLFPINYGDPIPVVLNIKIQAERVSGKARASLPSPTEGNVNGDKLGSLCNLTLNFGAGGKANLRGACSKESFTGEYWLFTTDGKKKTGSFRLMPEIAEKSANPVEEAMTPGLTLAECIRHNTSCLVGCPRGDYNTEFLCANACRRKKLACEARLKRSRIDAPVAAPSEENP